MSVHQTCSLTCPHCQHEEKRSVVLSVNAGNADEEIAAILDGTFQRFACSSCGTTYRADGPFIYLDFAAKIWIGVFPEPGERDWWVYEREPHLTFDRAMLDRCAPIVRTWAPGFRIRTVFGIDGLREKLVADAAGIDDRVLEAFKLALLRDMGEYDLGPAARPRLQRIDGTDAIFHVPRPEPGAPLRYAIVRIRRKEIDRIPRDAADEWKSVIDTLSAGPYVDLGRLFIPRPDTAVDAAS